jgi:predicted PurR-regulated permease PerM
MSDQATVPDLRDRALGIIAAGAVLGMLYFGRHVLVPITLAVILSLLIAPMVRALRRWGMGATTSVLAAVLALALAGAAVAAVIGVQLARLAQGVPKYEETIRHKFSALNELGTERLAAFTEQTERLVGERGEGLPRPAGEGLPRPAPAPASSEAPARVEPIPVVMQEPPLSPLQVAERVLGSVWLPLETAGIVLVVLVFVLLERESVRDRFIRIAGGSDLRATTLVLNDAGERLSKFFVSQFVVNLGVGAAIGLGLAVIGLPHATLFAALATVLRFVPYIGMWIAALFSAILGAAVVPGWSLAIITLCLFATVELIASQLVEPQLYGHATGLSPLSVVVAAIFWSSLWGPVGLVVSTPLTLCLVVAGRHIKALSLLDILLGDNEALTMPERFYQRALSADSEELIASARGFLKQSSLAAYCDFVVMPAMRLAVFDLARGSITHEQQLKLRQTIVAVIEAIDRPRRRFVRRRHATSVLDQMSAGRQLRQQRVDLIGRWQGPLVVPPGSVMLCVSLGSILDDLAAELLVRVLREKKLDARHLSLEDLHQPPPEGSAVAVSLVYLVSGTPDEQRKVAESAAEQIRRRFPRATFVAFFLPALVLQQAAPDDTIRSADKTATSFGEALRVGIDLLEERSKT